MLDLRVRPALLKRIVGAPIAAVTSEWSFRVEE